MAALRSPVLREAAPTCELRLWYQAASSGVCPAPGRAGCPERGDRKRQPLLQEMEGQPGR